MPNRFFVWLLHCLLASPAVGQVQPLPAPALPGVRQTIYLTDTNSRLTVFAAWQRSVTFTPVPQARVSLGVGRPPIWMRINVANPAAAARTFVVSVDNSFLDDVRFFQLSASGNLIGQSGKLGWSVLPASRPVNHRYPAFRFRVPAHRTHGIMVRVASPSQPMLFSIYLRGESDFWIQDRQERLFWNWLFGISCWYIVVGLIFAFLLKRAVYGYYSLYVLGVCAYLMAIKGFWLEWFPAVQYGPVSGRMIPPFLTFSSMLAGFLFVRHYIFSAVWGRPWIRRLYYLAISLLLLALVFICLEQKFSWFYVREIRWAAPFMSGLYLVPLVLVTSLIIYLAWQERTTRAGNLWQSPASLYLISLLPLVANTIGRILHNYALVADNPLVHFEGVALSYLGEFILLSIGLGSGYRSILHERQRLTQQALRHQLLLQQEQNRALQSQLRLQHEKERIARDLHDNVGAQLSVIATSLDHIQRTQTLNGAGQQLDKIGTYARDAIGSLRETIWAINSEHISLEAFRLQLQQYLARQQGLLSHCSFQLNSNVSSLTAGQLSSEQALNLFRICQEAIQNAFRHARAERITVTLTIREPDQLCLEITDDGIGFGPTAEYPGHYGLLNMQQRANDLGGSCLVESAPGQGARITISLRIKNT